MENLRRLVTKPLRPYFVSREQQPKVDETDTHPIVCCSASGEEAGDGDCYVQGAGDDTENWANGLTANVFWPNLDKLIAIESEEELEVTIQKLVASKREGKLDHSEAIRPTLKSAPIHIGTLDALKTHTSRYDCMVLCSDTKASDRSESASHLGKTYVLTLDCGKGKAASRSIRNQMPRLISFLEHVKSEKPYPSILVTCASGKDLSIGVALTILCLYYDDEGNSFHE